MRALPLACLCWFAVLFCPRALKADVPDYQIKSAFLVNFSRYTHWPEPNTPRLCVHGDEAVAQWLQVQQLRLQIESRLVRRPDELNGCTVLYLAASSNLRWWLGQVQQEAILTVSDHDQFLAQGGMIQLQSVDASIRFSINLKAARQAQLLISSRLLALATKIEGAAP